MRRFFLEVVPKILDLPLGRNEPRNQILESLFLSRWQDHFIGGVRRRVDVPYLTPRDLADLARAYTEILPENLPIGQMRLPTASLIEDPRAATEEDYDAFYRTVAASKHNTSSLRGRFTLLENQLKVAQMTPTVRALHGIARRVAKIIRRASKPLTAAV